MSRDLLNQFKFVLTECELRQIKKLELSLNSTLLLLYFINQTKPLLDLDSIKKLTNLNEEEIMESFNELLTKDIIEIKMNKNKEKKIEEEISLDNFYQMIEVKMKELHQEKDISKIFKIFESEFGRPLSPMEYELITGWLQSGMKEELLVGALKEAVFNGVKNFRYIDKIVYEWEKKGFKTMEDVSNHLRKREHEKPSELFDYNWLEDDK